MNRRTSSISSQRASRPPSLSYSTTGSEASIALPNESQPQEITSAAQPSLFSRLALVGSSTSKTTTATPTPADEPTAFNTATTAAPSSIADASPPMRGSEPPSTQNLTSTKDSNRSGITSIPEERGESNTTAHKITQEACTCGCHGPPLPPVTRPIYANASVQTDPIPSPPRSALRVDTFKASTWGNSHYSAISRDVQTPFFDNSFCAAPFSMGRMTNYFSKPGYQLGDSLASGYHNYEQPVYQYQDEFEDDALR